MSDISNNNLLERAEELIEEIVSHPSGYDVRLRDAIDSGNLDNVRYVVSVIQSELARDHFYNYDLVF